MNRNINDVIYRISYLGSFITKILSVDIIDRNYLSSDEIISLDVLGYLYRDSKYIFIKNNYVNDNRTFYNVIKDSMKNFIRNRNLNILISE